MVSQDIVGNAENSSDQNELHCLWSEKVNQFIGIAEEKEKSSRNRKNQLINSQHINPKPIVVKNEKEQEQKKTKISYHRESFSTA